MRTRGRSIIRAAVVVGTVSTSALGGISLSVEPANPAPASDGRFSLTFAFENPDRVNVWGFSLLAKSDLIDAGKLHFYGVHRFPPCTDPNFTWDVTIEPPKNYDLGATAAIGVGNNARYVPLMTLDMRLDPRGMLELPATIVFQSYAFDVDFNQFDPEDVVVTIVPEPAGLLLLACGAALLHRRRRV